MLSMAACSSGGSSSSSDSNSAVQGNIDGEWQTACESLPDNQSIRELLEFTGSTLESTNIFYIGSDSCSTGNIFTVTITGEFSLPGGTTDTALGAAQHIDIEVGSINANSSQPLEAQLALQNMTFEQLLETELAISNPSNINPQILGIQSPLFSLILADGDTLYLGDDQSNQGNSPETRLTELGQDVSVIYTRR